MKISSTLIIWCDYLIFNANCWKKNICFLMWQTQLRRSFNKKYVPKTYLAKGNYFSLNKKLPITHLIYPLPEKISLGIHLTLEIDHSIKFGSPCFSDDAEWVDDPYDYSVDENLKSKFVNSINKYLPNITEDMLNPA